MTMRRFLDLVRQYSAAKKNHKQSYGAQVQTLWNLWSASVVNSSMSDAQKQAQLDWAKTVIQVEYAPLDAGWSLKLDA